MLPRPPVSVTRVNLKPLVSQGDLEKISPARVLARLQQSILKRLRLKILNLSYSDRAKKALSRGMKVKVGPSSITVVATHPAFIPLLRGQHAKQMTWLMKSRKPIPIVLDSGEVIFRNATPRSMQNGSWYHPGRRPTTIIEQAKKEAREAIIQNIERDLKRQVRAALQKAFK